MVAWRGRCVADEGWGQGSVCNQLSGDRGRAPRLAPLPPAGLFCSTYITEDPRVEEYKAQLNQLEAELANERNAMDLGYAPPGAAFRKASSVQLRNTMRTAADEAERQAAYEGLRSIGPFVAERFAAIVKLRNKLARAAGGASACGHAGASLACCFHASSPPPPHPSSAQATSTTTP